MGPTHVSSFAPAQGRAVFQPRGLLSGEVHRRTQSLWTELCGESQVWGPGGFSPAWSSSSPWLHLRPQHTPTLPRSCLPEHLAGNSPTLQCLP